MLKRSIVTAMLCWPLASVNAQHALVLQKLTEWNAAAPAPASERINAEILSSAKQIYVDNAACAASDVTIEAVSPATSERFVFTSIVQQRLRNAWSVTARLPGCDTAPVRFMIIQDKADRLQTIRVNRGRSHAWDSLIGDTLPLAQVAAMAALTRRKIECTPTKAGKLGVVRIASEDENLGRDVFGVRYAGSWGEVWPIEICDRVVEVVVNFTADGDGGAYTDIPGERIAILSRLTQPGGCGPANPVRLPTRSLAPRPPCP